MLLYLLLLTATDNCNASPTISYSIAGNPITFPYDFTSGSTTVDVLADDTNGQTVTCSFDVIVQDNEDPVITCPTPNASYDTDAGQCDATLSFTATATDNCNTSSYYNL